MAVLRRGGAEWGLIFSVSRVCGVLSGCVARDDNH